MSQKNKIATQSEVLAFFTDVMRRDIDDNVKISEAMSAAEKLYRHYREEKPNDTNQKETGVVLLPEVKRKEETK